VSIKQRLQADLKSAIRARDERRKAVIRLTLSAITHAEFATQGGLDDAGVGSILQREARKRQETIEEPQEADRPGQLAKEKAQLAILEEYVPRLMTRDEITVSAQQAIAWLGATGMAQMGLVMRTLMPQLRGRADGRIVNEVVREMLSG
jgi:uncharacterized protein YqeY